MTGMRMKKRIAAVLLSLLTLFSASCGVLEMREADPEPLPVTDRLLEQARKPAEAEAGEQLPGLQLYTLPEEEAVEPVVTFAFAGDILIDTFIITDAARKAGEGQNYSFLRTFSGVYRNLEVADVTVGFDSSATHPKGDSDPTHRTPREALETLSAAGYDVLNTLAWQDEKGLIADCGMEGISTASGGTNAFSAEIKGVNVSVLAVGGEALPIGSDAANARIGEEAENSDFLVVMADWTPGMTSGEQCAAAYYMAEAGADVIVGTGNSVGSVDWLERLDGGKTLVAYSLGNLLPTATSYENLTGGIFTFTADLRSGVVSVRDVTLTPTFTHMEAGRREVQVFPLSSYRDELAGEHYIRGLTTDALRSYIRSVVPAVCLPNEYRD